MVQGDGGEKRVNKWVVVGLSSLILYLRKGSLYLTLGCKIVLEVRTRTRPRHEEGVRGQTRRGGSECRKVVLPEERQGVCVVRRRSESPRRKLPGRRSTYDSTSQVISYCVVFLVIPCPGALFPTRKRQLLTGVSRRTSRRGTITTRDVR